jgi:hypothetical protein
MLAVFFASDSTAARSLTRGRKMCSDSCNRKRYLGVDFVIWRNEGTWFWLLINASGEG